jgi:PKHD-type hydroxylase
MNSIWQMWARDISPTTCNKIIQECEQLPSKEAAVGGQSVNAVDSKVRKSEIRWAGDIQWIKDLIYGYAATANRNAFGFDINYLADVQYTIYKGSEEGHYDWHYDTFWAGENAYDRKISVIIQLSNPSDYEGGEFLLEPQYEQPNPTDLKQRGTVFCFPSFLRHTVKPVTKGIRKSLVAWVEGPKFR